MTDDERSKLYLDRLLSHLEKTKERKFYSIQRFDLLVISISGAGLYTIFETFKFFTIQHMKSDFTFPRVAGIHFAIAIIINVVSLWSGYKANALELERTELLISEEKENPKKDASRSLKLRKLKVRIASFNNWTSWMNINATRALISGMILLAIFYTLVS